jgi:hypothetical protein
LERDFENAKDLSISRGQPTCVSLWSRFDDALEFGEDRPQLVRFPGTVSLHSGLGLGLDTCKPPEGWGWRVRVRVRVGP